MWHNSMHRNSNGIICLVSSEWQLHPDHLLYTSDENKAKQIAEIFGHYSDWKVWELKDGLGNTLNCSISGAWALNKNTPLHTNDLAEAKKEAQKILNPLVWTRLAPPFVTITTHKGIDYILYWRKSLWHLQEQGDNDMIASYLPGLTTGQAEERASEDIYNVA